MRLPFYEGINRARRGPRVKEGDFDLTIYRKAQELVKDYDIKYDPENPIPCDNSLADNLFEAALKFFLDVGVYCTSTGRVVKFSEEEVKEELRSLVTEVTLGEGRDAVTMVHRQVGDSTPPVVSAGIQTVLFSDVKMMYEIYKLCALDTCVDGLWAGIVPTIEGKYEVIAGTPFEIYPYRKGTEVLRKAIADAGRPGMFMMNNAPSSYATIALADREKGLRPCDPFMVTGVTEMKIAFDDLNRAAFALSYGSSIHFSHSAMVGGFSGSREGAALVATAAGFMAIMVSKAESFRLGVIHSTIKSRQSRDGIWAASLALQAFARNTKAIIDGSTGDHPAAGPGTKQYLYEAAAGFITSTVSGGHSTEGTRKFAIGQTLNYGTPLESRWMGEACKGSAGISREKANEIVKYLLEKYEGNLKTAPPGWTFEHLYDLETMKPKHEYVTLYNGVQEELSEFGLRFQETI